MACDSLSMKQCRRDFGVKVRVKSSTWPGLMKWITECYIRNIHILENVTTLNEREQGTQNFNGFVNFYEWKADEKNYIVVKIFFFMTKNAYIRSKQENRGHSLQSQSHSRE